MNAAPTAEATPAPAPCPAGAPPPRIDSDRLFAGAREVQIVHRGIVYRLKQTALGKLILTK
jgi:hemin uptake protein HemP